MEPALLGEGKVGDEQGQSATTALGAMWAGEAAQGGTTTPKQFEVQCAFLRRHVPRAYFVQHVDTLNADQYRDVITERAIAGLCGFPLCTNDLPVAPIRRPGQKYRISAREKRVYDVSQRINFCSDECLIAAKMEEVHLHDQDEEMPPIPRTIVDKGDGPANNHAIVERVNVEPPSMDFNGTAQIEGYSPGKIMKPYSHPSQTKRSAYHDVFISASSTRTSSTEVKPRKTAGPNGPLAAPNKPSRSGRTPEDWVKNGPTIIKGMLDKRPKVKILALDEAIALEMMQSKPPAPRSELSKKKEEREVDNNESDVSSDDEDSPIKPELNTLPLFAQLWNSLSDWPTSRSRALIKGVPESENGEGELTTSKVELERDGMDEEEEQQLDETFDVMPVSDADQERARWRVIRGMLLRELPAVCAQMHISVPIHGQLCRLLESFNYPKPLAYKPHQLRLVLLVLLEVLGLSDKALREQINACEEEKRRVISAHGLDVDEWRLLVEIFSSTAP